MEAGTRFGQDAGNGLYKFTSYAVSHPDFLPYSWLVEHVVLKAFTPFGWLVLIAETTLAVLLLTGACMRLAAVTGVAQSVAIGLSVAYAPDEWPWFVMVDDRCARDTPVQLGRRGSGCRGVRGPADPADPVPGVRGCSRCS